MDGGGWQRRNTSVSAALKEKGQAKNAFYAQTRLIILKYFSI